MPRDYYLVLGISRSADLNRIKKAYRTVAKQYHPDMTHSQATARQFQEVKEAYETLSDEDRRERYDRELAGRDPHMGREVEREDFWRRKPGFGVDEGGSAGPVDEFFSGFVPGMLDQGGGAVKDLYCEVVLSPTEAAQGGLFPLRVPVTRTCPGCHGGGYGDVLFCSRCHGTGIIEDSREFSVSIPPNVAHGTQVRLSLEDIGLNDASIHILVVIDPGLDAPIW
jgi:molecular chaperone DnaJ